MIKRSKKIFIALFCSYIAIMIVFCIIGAIPTGNNTWEKGAKIYFPYEDDIVGNQLQVIGGIYSKDEIISAELIINPLGITIPIEREKIFYKERELLTLSSFKVPVAFEYDGEYTASIILTDVNGEYEFENLQFVSNKDVITKGFEMFSLQHGITLLLVLCLYIAIMLIYKRNSSKKTKNMIYIFLSIGIILCDFAVKLWLIKNGLFKISYDAFLHMCDISGPLLIIMFFMKDSKRRRILFSLMFIWGVLGATMALLTPEMRGNVFPSMYFMTFFIKHGIIVMGVLIVGVVEKYTPKMKHLPIVMVISMLIVAIVYGINKLIAYLPPYEVGNYMFLSYPPTGGSAIDILVDIFGPSPYYIVGMALLAIGLYTIMWGIYWITGKTKPKQEPK